MFNLNFDISKFGSPVKPAGGGGGGAWTPSTPGNLVANWIPSINAYSDVDATTLANDGEKIASIGSTSLVSATQGTEANRPTLTSNYSIHDSTDYFQNVGNNWVGQGDTTLIYSISASSARSIYGEGRSGVTTDYVYFAHSNTYLRIVLVNSSSSVHDIADMSFTYGQKEIRAITLKASTKEINAYKWTTSLEASASNPITASFWPTAACDRLALGSRIISTGYSDQFIGHFYGMLIYDKILSSSELESACTYLDAL